MKASDKSPVHQLLRAVLRQSKKRIYVPKALERHLMKSASVFDLTKLSVGELRTLGLKPEEAEALLSRGRALALNIARLYRQQHLRGVPRPSDKGMAGPLPTYQQIFSPDVDGAAALGSPEHSASTTAYLVALRQWIRELIEPKAGPGAIPLTLRRSDVDDLLIDEAAINQVKSRVEINSTILEALILSKEGESFSTAKDYLRSIRFPQEMPYEHDRLSIRHVVRQVVENGSLGEVIRRLDPKYPYFKNAGGRGPRDDAALQQSIGSGPALSALLLESPYFGRGTEPAGKSLQRVDPSTGRIDADPQKSAGDFYLENFGSLVIANASLRRLWIFRLAMGFTQDQVDCFLAMGRYTPKLSPNAPALGDPDEPLTGEVAGARFIHGGTEPAIGIEYGDIEPRHLLTNIGEDSALEHRTDRMQRKSRLDRLLGLPSYLVDRILIAVMNAERRGGADAALWIRSSTLSAVGLFVELSAKYDCTAEDFAGILDVLSPHGQNGVPAFFDQGYNHSEPFDDPLKITDREFAIIPITSADQQTVQQICKGLGINPETYRYLATVIAEAFGLRTHLKCNLETLSSFWRLVRLARMFGLTPIELTALLQTLGLAPQLAGRPLVSAYGTTDAADALSTIHAVMTCVEWTNDFNVPVPWLVQYVNPVYVPTVWTESQEQFLLQLSSQVQPILVKSATLLEAGAPARTSNDQPIDWLQLLGSLVDDKGAVVGRYDETEEQFLARANEAFIAIAKHVYPSESPPPDVVRDRAALHALLLMVVLRCRDEQRVLVEVSLSVFLKLGELLTAQVLMWAQGHSYEFLKEALVTPVQRQRRKMKALEEPDLFLKTFAEVERRARIADKLKLSPSLLARLLTGENFLQFSLEDRFDISINTIYCLALFGRLVERARQPEEKIYDYLGQANDLPNDLSPDAQRLFRDAAADKLARFFGCGIGQVLKVVEHINAVAEASEEPALPLLRTLEDLGVLMRTLELASKGMDAETAVTLGKLNLLDGNSQYQQGAQKALESLSRFNDSKTSPDSAEVGQSYNTHCVVDNTSLIVGLDLEVAEFLITLLDFFGIPLAGVTLYIETDLGVVLTPTVTTDRQGRAWARLQAGARVGTAHLRYSLPFHDPQFGPSVRIGPDLESAQARPLQSSEIPRDPVLAGNLWEQEVFTTVMDRYGNPVAHYPVLWRTTVGQIRPRQTVTDKDGVSKVWISSLSPGDARITVGNVDESHSFTFTGLLKFADKPRISGNPFVSDVAMAGQPLEVRCKVVGLDDEPVAHQRVEWWTSSDASKTGVDSDINGVCLFSLASLEAGPLTIFAQLGSDAAVELTVWVASGAVIRDFLQNIPFPVVGATATPVWIVVKESDDPSAPALEHYPVRWTVDSDPPVDVILKTDEPGRSEYLFSAKQAGEFKVTAMLEQHPLEPARVFNLTAIKAFGWTVTLIIIADDGSETSISIIPGRDTLELYRDGHYRLEIAATDPSQIVGTQGALGWSSTYSTQALAMVFDPPMARRFDFTESAHSVDIHIGNVRNGDFQIGVYADLLEQVLVLEGTLRKRSVVRGSPSKS